MTDQADDEDRLIASFAITVAQLTLYLIAAALLLLAFGLLLASVAGADTADAAKTLMWVVLGLFVVGAAAGRNQARLAPALIRLQQRWAHKRGIS